MKLEYKIEVHPTCEPDDFEGVTAGEWDAVVTGKGRSPYDAAMEAHQQMMGCMDRGLPVGDLIALERSLAAMESISTCAEGEVQFVSIYWRRLLAPEDPIT